MTITKNSIMLRLLAAGVVVGSIAAVGCGGDDDDDDAATDPGTETPADDGGDAGNTGGGDAVSYSVDSLQYSDVSAPAGGTIQIENSSGAPHTFTADDGAFDVAYDPDQPATVEVPAEPGEYPFHCSVHASMQATLTVE